MIRLKYVCSLLVVLFACQASNADTIGYWNFNTYDGDASSIAADSGNGTITIDSSWVATDLDNFSGSTLNALNGDPAGSSLSLIDQTNNGTGLNLAIDTTMFEDLELSFATRGTGTGFMSNTVFYSADGGANFAPLGAAYIPGTAFDVETFDLSSITALNNNPNVVVRIVFDGATGASGNNRIDNIQFNGEIAVPEPAAVALIGLLGLVAGTRRRR